MRQLEPNSDYEIWSDHTEPYVLRTFFRLPEDRSGIPSTYSISSVVIAKLAY